MGLMDLFTSEDDDSDELEVSADKEEISKSADSNKEEVAEKEGGKKKKKSINLATFIELQKELEEQGTLSKAAQYSNIPVEDLLSKEFDPDKSKYSKMLLDTLVKDEILKDYDWGHQYVDINKEEFLELSSKQIAFSVNDDGDIVYSETVGGKEKVMNLTLNIENMSKGMISELLPDVELDVNQCGIKERQSEIASMYKVVAANNIFDNIYNPNIAQILANYDFKQLLNPKEKGDDRYSFTKLLLNIQSNSSVTLRMILSACDIKLANAVTKKETSIFRSLLEEENRGLAEIKLKIAVIRNESEKIQRKKKEVWEKKKEKLSLETKISEIISESPHKNVYKILKLTSEAVPEIVRLTIANEAKVAAASIKEKEKLTRDSLVRSIERKLRKRAMREFLIEQKQEYLKRYRKDPENFEIRSLR
jgi:hypothetical protein